MNSWQRWVKAPQTLWFRRLLFQVHLWMGIGVGLYVLMISITGSAVVLRPQISQWFTHSRVEPDAGKELKGAALEARVAQVYSDYQVTKLAPPRRPNGALYVALEKDGEESSRYFDQYRGIDLGSTFPLPVAAVEWLVDLHDDLLMGRQGRKVNGIGGGLFLVMVLTGMIIWWQGKTRWADGMMIKRGGSRGFNWQLHSFIGFWTLLLMFVWGVTALYFAFPEPFDFIIDALDDDLNDFERPDGFLRFMIKVHFGRFGGMWGRTTWIILGFAPSVMFITGFILWWKRVVKQRWLK